MHDAAKSGEASKASTSGPRVLQPRRESKRIEPLTIGAVPALMAAACFALGAVMALRGWQRPVILLTATALCGGLTLLALKRAQRVAWMGAAAVWVCAGMWCVELQPIPSPQRELLSYADGLSRTVDGTVMRSGRMLAQPHGSIEGMETTDIAVDAVEDVQPETSRMQAVGGGVRLTVFDDEDKHRENRGAPEADFNLTTMDASDSESEPQGLALPALHCGDHVTAEMQLRAPPRYFDPGVWDYAAYLQAQGIGTHASLAASKVTVTPATHRPLRCLVYAAQQWASGRMIEFTGSDANRRLPERLQLTAEDAGMLNAMVFGDRSRLDHALRTEFERTGCFHLFVVAGLHLGIVAGALFLIFKRMRVPLAVNSLLTLALATGYAMLTGWGVPVQRALVMTAVFLAARLMWRERSVLNALGVASLFVLVGAPRSLFEASFQMTFLALLAIGGLAAPLMERMFLPYLRGTRQIEAVEMDVTLPPRVAQFRVMLRLAGEHLQPLLGRRGRRMPAKLARLCGWCAELVTVGVVAELLMVVPMAIYFHRATVMAVPANVLSIPLICVLVPAAMLTWLLALVSQWAACVPGAATAAMLHGITAVIGRLSHAEIADVRMPSPGIWVVAAAGGLWVFALWAVRRSKGWVTAAAGSLALAATLVLWPWPAHTTPGRLEVTTIDVGQGDSILVVTPEGRTLLVDAGGPVGGPFAQSSVDIGEEVVSPYLWSRRIRRLDVVALTHAHSDHIGGMGAVLRNMRPRELWVGINPMTPAYRALLEQAAEQHITVRSFVGGDGFEFGGTHVDVLAPQRGYVPGPKAANNDSLVLEMHYGKASALLEGDAEWPSEEAMLAAGRVQPATLLKVGHHGSRSSSTPEFLAAAQPVEAAISCGRHNPFGHPRAEVVAEFAGRGTPLWRTDLMGVSTFTLDAAGRIESQSYEGMR